MYSSMRTVILFLVLCAVSSGFLFGSPMVTLNCHWDEFPCDDGQCIEKTMWCDTEVNCKDGSDEKYCAKKTHSSEDPNNCTETKYFKCKDGPCIPIEGLCDDYVSCRDSSDEANCNDETETVMSTSTKYELSAAAEDNSAEQELSIILGNETSIYSPEVTESTMLPLTTQTNSLLLEHEQNDVQWHGAYISKSRPYVSPQVSYPDKVPFTSLNPKEFSHERDMSQSWLLSERNENFGWNDHTTRALTALFLSNSPEAEGKTESKMLMIKQLHLQLSLAIMRNSTREIALSDLSLYINALTAVCSNPEDFYGLDLVAVLRQRTNLSQKAGKFVSPSVYLTLCARNSTTLDDVRKIQETFTSRSPAMDRIDVQSLATLAASCIVKNPTYQKSLLLQDFGRRLKARITNEGLPENIYELSLLVQAMNEARVSESLWDRSKAMNLIRKQQNSNGSFGDILATYYVLPLLSGKSLVSLRDSCSNHENDFTPLDVLKNADRERIYVRYSLYLGDPVEVSQTLQLNVAKGTNFLDIMRLAEDINPNFKFQFDSSRGTPRVFSIGNIANDAEKGLYWILHVSSRNSTENTVNLIPFNNDIRQHVPNTGDHTVFWMKSLA